MANVRGSVPGTVKQENTVARVPVHTDLDREAEEAAREQRRLYILTFLKMVQFEYEQHQAKKEDSSGL